MGKADSAAKLFYSKQENFISVVKLVYGDNLIEQKAENIREGLFSYVESMLGYKSDRKVFKGVLGRNRDAIKKVCIDNQNVLLGIENQDKIDCLEPVRIMLYDAMSYEEQGRLIKWIHHSKKDLKADEYISGFSHKDRLIPVETIVIYYGEEEWTYPLNLSDICPVSANSVLKNNIQDYRIKVIDVRRLSDVQINSLSPEVKLLFGCVKYSKDIKQLREFIETDRMLFENLSQETFEIIALMTKTNKLLKEMKKVEKGGRFNMCKAIDDMIEEGKQAGIAVGRLAGIEEGKQAGIAEGRQAGIAEGRLAGITEGRLAGIAEGRQEERQNGIKTMLEALKYVNTSWETALNLLKEKFSLNDEAGTECMKKYW